MAEGTALVLAWRLVSYWFPIGIGLLTYAVVQAFPARPERLEDR